MVSKRHTDQALLTEPLDDGRILLAARPNCSVSYVEPSHMAFKVQMTRTGTARSKEENLAYLEGEGHRWSTCQDRALCPYDLYGVSMLASASSQQLDSLHDDGDTVYGALDLASLPLLVETARNVDG